VLLSAEAKDATQFERHMALLTPYYTDFGFAQTLPAFFTAANN